MSNRPAPRDDRGDVLAATIASGAMIAQQVAGKATRDALFLERFAIGSLPIMMIVGASLSFGAAIFAGRAITRHGPRRIARAAFGLSALAFAIEFLVSFVSRHTIAVAVYAHVALFGATAISIFWSVINERFDPHAAKRAVARIAAGGTLGGVVGGVIGWQVASLTSVRAMLVALALLNVVALLGIGRVRDGHGSRSPQPASIVPPSPDAAEIRARAAAEVSRYLFALGAMVVVVATTEALVDFTFVAQVDARHRDGRDLMAFFSAFHVAVGILTFLSQVFLSRRSLERLGLVGTIAVLPLVVVGLGGLALELPGLVTVVALRGGEAVISNSLWRSAYELLYTPVAQARKRSLKTLIDVGCDRLGTLIGSALVLAALWLGARFGAGPPLTLLVVAMMLGVVGLLLARRLHHGYVGSLEDSLRTGSVRLDETEIVDATTRKTLTASASAERAAQASPVARAPARVRAVAGRDERADPLIEAVVELRSGDRLRIQRALCTGEDDPRVASFVVPLLARDDVRAEAVAWLRRTAPRITGQLVDALLDPTLDVAARRRLPKILRASPTKAAADGLVRALADPHFEVRYAAGAALARIVEKDASIVVPAGPILDAVRMELAIERRLRDEALAPEWTDVDDERATGMFTTCDRVACDRATLGLEHVFTILSLLLDREPLRIAWRALSSGDEGLRGTALEYLENVLPPDLRDAVWPYVTGRGRVGRRRSRQEVLADLMRGRPSAARRRSSRA